MKTFLTGATAAFAALALISCNEPVSPEGNTTQESLVLEVSTASIQAGSGETVTLTVTYNGEDVSSNQMTSIWIVEDGAESQYRSLTWTSESICRVQFYAVYSGKVSNWVTVDAIGEINIPEDSEPDNYNFVKNTILLQGTGTWCPNCPGMSSALQTYLSTGTGAENALHVAAHDIGSDPSRTEPMTNTAAQRINRYYGITRFPSVVFDLDASTIVSGGNVFVESIQSAVSSALANEATCGIAAAVSASDGKIHVSADIKIGERGRYTVAAWLLEDGIEAAQSHEYQGYVTVTHNNVLRAASSINPVYGSYLQNQPEWESGSTARFDCDFEMSDVTDLSKSHVVVIVNSPRGTAWCLNNAINCPVNDSVNYQYN